MLDWIRTLFGFVTAAPQPENAFKPTLVLTRGIVKVISQHSTVHLMFSDNVPKMLFGHSVTPDVVYIPLERTSPQFVEFSHFLRAPHNIDVRFNGYDLWATPVEPLDGCISMTFKSGNRGGEDVWIIVSPQDRQNLLAQFEEQPI